MVEWMKSQYADNKHHLGLTKWLKNELVDKYDILKGWANDFQ